MSVSLDAIGPGSSAANAINTTSLTWSHTASSASVVLVVASFSIPSDTGVTMAVTSGGTPMTPVTGSLTEANTTAAQGYQQWFYLDSPPSGASTVVVSLTGGTANAFLGVSASFTGSATLGTVATSSNEFGNLSTTLTPTTSGNYVFTCGQTLQNDVFAFGSPFGTTLSSGDGAGVPLTQWLLRGQRQTGSAMTASPTTTTNYGGGVMLEVQAGAGPPPSAPPAYTAFMASM